MERLCQFRDYLNSLDPNLKLKMTVGENDELTFVDLRITLKNNKLFTTVYSKPTSSQIYLHADSIHPKSTFTGIQKGVSLRLRRICSTDEEFNERSKEYKAYLVARDHNPASVLKEFDRTANLIMTQAGVKHSDNRDKPKRLTTFVAEYNPRGPNIQETIKRHLNILQENPEVRKIFPYGAIIVANKRCKNLKELSARADPYDIREDLLPNPAGGYKICGKKCDSCNNMVDSTLEFVCKHSGKKFSIRLTQNIVYPAYCTKCGLQGVGSTVKWNW